ncbi:MAG: ferritin-like domain-containing protein [Deltaproteobacteria bacterium]|nr:ferritin-like domain-containing protein [Deltaproteobacteria bacterium]
MFWTALKRRGSRLLQSLPHDRRKELLSLLCREYIEETKTSMQYRRHAQRMRYPQFRERLLRIAEEEQKHAQWLEKRVTALGGEVPRISFAPEDGWNSWEQLRLDLDEEKRCIWDLEDQLIILDQIDPETAKLLRRILEEEINHRETITDMLIRSDPQAERPV